MNIESLKKKLIQHERALKEECERILETAYLEEEELNIPDEIKKKMGNALCGNGLKLCIDSLSTFGYEIICDKTEDRIILNNEYNSIIKCTKVYYLIDSNNLKFKLILEFKLSKPIINTNLRNENNSTLTIIGSSYYIFSSNLLISSVVNPNIYSYRKKDYQKLIQKEIIENEYFIFPDINIKFADEQSISLLKKYNVLNENNELIFEYNTSEPVVKLQMSKQEEIILEVSSERVNYKEEEKYLLVYTYIRDKLLKVGILRKLILNIVTININYQNNVITKKLGTIVILQPDVTKFILEDNLYLEFEPKYWMSNLSYKI